MAVDGRTLGRAALRVALWWAVALAAVLVGFVIIYNSAWTYYTDGESTGWEILLLPLLVVAVGACVLAGRVAGRMIGQRWVAVVVTAIPLTPLLVLLVALS